jgi:hypothetical protein
MSLLVVLCSVLMDVVTICMVAQTMMVLTSEFLCQYRRPCVKSLVRRRLHDRGKSGALAEHPDAIVVLSWALVMEIGSTEDGQCVAG